MFPLWYNTRNVYCPQVGSQNLSLSVLPGQKHTGRWCELKAVRKYPASLRFVPSSGLCLKSQTTDLLEGRSDRSLCGRPHLQKQTHTH